MWIIILIILVLLAFVAVAWAILEQRKAAGQVADFELAKRALLNEKVDQQIQAAKKISLSGQALREYEAIQGQYSYLTKTLFAKMDQERAQAESKTAGLNVWGTKNALRRLLSLTKEAAQVQASIKDGLDNLYQQNDRHHAAIRQLHDEHEQILLRIENEPESFGPATAALADFVKQSEKNYQEYLALQHEEKAVEASEAFEALGMEAGQLTSYLQSIPMIFQTLNVKFVEQVQEIVDGKAALETRGVIFDQAAVQENLAQIDDDRLAALSALSHLKIKEATELEQQINQQIQALYELLEKEYAAYNRYFKQTDLVKQAFERISEQNHSLMIELAYLKSRFQLTHDEEKVQQEAADDIEDMVANQQEVATALSEKELLYSEACQEQEKWLTRFKELDTKQVALYKQIEAFQPALQSAKKHAADAVAQLKDLKRSLERRDLPGLPKDFLDHFFALSDEMTRLNEGVNASLVDLDGVQRQLNIVASDLDTVKEEAKTVAIQADLAVTLLQYASRYAANSSQMKQSLQEAQTMYDQDFDFAGVIELIKPILNEAEPEAYARLVANQDPVTL
ncbi:hypothetical protein LQZ24_04525 [Fructobacillus sp. M1-13]|uniref:Septation ring formation regulator EzrA n=1 Tax=Fructobacillus papyriferae TaxID=2713171 RepID=A0ABS5QR68_9LACO|nr:septation ring formation regulator EzrA [Fructobacillus papyriferae]MBS9335621.1 hypothetical protein [Fructobacillus papyriferae]MCD2159290.1 hypothetical protein [Fructobacillus papyriferae]